MILLISAQSAGALPAVLDCARREIAQLDPHLPVGGVMLAEENLSLAYWDRVSQVNPLVALRHE